MPSFTSLAQLGVTGLNGILSRNAQGGAVRTLTSGGTQGINTITQGAQAAQNTLQNNFTNTQGTLAPFISAGQKATGQIAGTAPYTPGTYTPQTFNWSLSDLANDPAYQFRVKQGQAAIEAGANAGGTRFSGATLKDLSAFNTGQAAQAEQQDYERQLGIFNTNAGNQFSAFKTNEANKAGAYNTNLSTLQKLANEGLTASGQQVSAGNSTAAGTAAIQMGSAAQIANLQEQIANAQAAGQVGQAATLQNTLNGLLSGAQETGLLNQNSGLPSGSSGPTITDPTTGKQVPAPVSQVNAAQTPTTTMYNPTTGQATQVPTDQIDQFAQEGYTQSPNPDGNVGAANGQPPQTTQQYNPLTGQLENVAAAAPAIAGGIAAAAGAGAAGAGAGGAVLTMSGALPSLASAGAAGAGVGTAAAGGGIETAIAAPSAAASGGTMASLGAFFTNPWTIGIGAALAGALIWKNSQVHPTANEWTQGTQTDFGYHLGSIVDAFDKSLASGQLTKQQAQLAYQQTADLISSVEQKAAAFAQAKGSKGKTVIDQFHQEMTKDFGPNYQGILGKMQSEIANLPDQAAA